MEKRQFVKYNFYKVDPIWRRLEPQIQQRDKREFLAVVDEFSSQMLVRSYSLTGIRGEVDFLLWLVSWEIEALQEFAGRVNGTGLGKYLLQPYSYLAMTRHSQYVAEHRHPDQEGTRTVIRPPKNPYPYLVIYPFTKTSSWYQLPFQERQEMMNAHITTGHKYPSVRINTTYSFGIDDQEFVVAFDTSSLSDFQDLVMDLREQRGRMYTEKDTPIFTCIQQELKEALDRLS